MGLEPVMIFADPEPAILRSARRVLHRGLGEWQLYFCESIDDALMLAQSYNPWVLVLDDSLLGEDLSAAHNLFQQAPFALRVILTSSAHENILYGSARIAHLVLPKPFQKEDLERALTRAIACAQLTMSEELRACIGALTSLPVLPEVYRRVSAELGKEVPDVDQIAEVISCQPQVLARLLHIANSALFGFSTPAKDTQQVIMRLGLNMVKHLVLFSGLFSSDNPKLTDEKMAQLSSESQQFAARLQALAERAGYSKAVKADCWVAGLMHNIGKLVILDCSARVGEEYEQLQDEHASSGALLMMLWGFPLEIARALELQNSEFLPEGEPVLVQLVNATKLISRKDFEPSLLDNIENLSIRNACKADLQTC